MTKILCLGAHPDDVEIGMGGTVASMTTRGIQVLILDLTNGEPTPFGSPEIRSKESMEAAKILGAQRKTLDMPNRYLQDTVENRNQVAGEIRLFQPDFIFAPYFVDAHPDHIAASQLADAGRFYGKFTKTSLPGDPWFAKRVIYYFPIHVRLQLNPSFAIDISKFQDVKRKAMLTYHSQFIASKKEAFIEQILNENKHYGFQIGTEAAEVFYQRETIAFQNFPEDCI